jgi:ABC-type nitrate/sulfonate/bicarbonate transport system substrate-binding protein
MKRFNVRRQLVLAIGAAAIMAFGCTAAASPTPTGPYKLHMRMTPSNAAWIVAQDQHLFDNIDLTYELVGYGESAQLFLAGTDPVGQESPWEAARFQSEGENISYFGTPAALRFNSGVIIRSEDADKYKTLDDLKGKKLGHPGFGTGTWQAFEIISKANYKLDAKTDFQPVEADPGALLGLLQTGEIDATINFTGQTATSMTRPDMKVILNFSEEWEKSHGQPLVINGPMARRDWLDANQDVARRLVEGVDKGLDWMKEHPEEFKTGGKYAKVVEGEGWLADPATNDRIIEELLAGTWYLKANAYNQAWVDSVYQFIEQGKGVFADTIPPKDKVFYLPLLQK